MAGEITIGVISAGSALGGGVVVGVSNYIINRAQTRDAHTAELRRTLTALLTVILRIDHQLRVEPRPGTAVRVVNEQMESRLPWFDYTIGRVRRRLFEPHLDTLVNAMQEAMAATLLIAPIDLLPTIEVVSQLMANYTRQDKSWRAKWDEACSELTVACRVVLGEAVGSRPPGMQD